MSLVKMEMYSPLEAISEMLEVSSPMRFTKRSCFTSCLALQINLFFKTPEEKLTRRFVIHSRKPRVSSRSMKSFCAPRVAELKSRWSQKLSMESMEGSAIIKISMRMIYHFCFRRCLSIILSEISRLSQTPR